MNELTDQPDDQVVEIARRVSERDKKAPNISVEMVDGIARLTIVKNSDPDERLRLMAAIGTYDLDFLSPLLSQIGNSVAAKGEMQEASLQFVIAFIKSIEPESEIETMLAAQMAAVHICALDASRRYLSTTSLAGKDSAERAMTKLTRTFTTQMEALKRHRAKAQQTVRVERVNVESGGQAIVGDVSHRGEG
ncbi:hypothetical protein PEL8287_02235 [Roseovarius litorisediminis]|uniref:Uncharacterized protein n=2 Tax=Roseovarius TaxID=74030 RepID=A0A1Y5SSI9_9RHOB|nr:hypothetical protein [Roseovarius litorisediminis]SLN44171.1 hypothetical protein PEL8287_02235 [Roseovarius litorisediminis]